MRYHFKITPRTFHFKQPAGTSRGVYLTRQSWLVEATANELPEQCGLGECAPLPDLSCDASENYFKTLFDFCQLIEQTGELHEDMLRPYPSMLFGIETALLSLHRGSDALFDTGFARGEEGISINGLVWMGSFEEMLRRMDEKLKQGFHCVKLKIGAIDFDRELELVRQLRQNFTKEQIQLRVDANGGFSVDDAMQKLEQLAHFDIHSIEQPIQQKQWCSMAWLCRESPIPIALDEELIGVNMKAMKEGLLNAIRPAYIVLKPSLHGGMAGTREWVQLARERGIGSWITSALESNVGLNAIAHLTADIYGQGITMPQGLGTGLLFTDNIAMHLSIRGDRLWYDCPQRL